MNVKWRAVYNSITQQHNLCFTACKNDYASLFGLKWFSLLDTSVMTGTIMRSYSLTDVRVTIPSSRSMVHNSFG